MQRPVVDHWRKILLLVYSLPLFSCKWTRARAPARSFYSLRDNKHRHPPRRTRVSSRPPVCTRVPRPFVDPLSLPRGGRGSSEFVGSSSSGVNSSFDPDSRASLRRRIPETHRFPHPPTSPSTLTYHHVSFFLLLLFLREIIFWCLSDAIFHPPSLISSVELFLATECVLFTFPSWLNVRAARNEKPRLCPPEGAWICRKEASSCFRSSADRPNACW